MNEGSDVSISLPTLVIVFFILAILMCVKWYLTVVQTSFKKNVHRKFLYSFPMASTMNANHSIVVVSCVENRMEGSLENLDKVHKKAQRLGMARVLF